MSSRLHGREPSSMSSGSSAEPTLRHTSIHGPPIRSTWQHRSSCLPSPSTSATSKLSARPLVKLQVRQSAIRLSDPKMRPPETGNGPDRKRQSPVSGSLPAFSIRNICSRSEWCRLSFARDPITSDGRPLPSQSTARTCRYRPTPNPSGNGTRPASSSSGSPAASRVPRLRYTLMPPRRLTVIRSGRPLPYQSNVSQLM